MPEYDPTNPPKPMSDDLTPIEVGRDPLTPNERGSWPSSNLLPEEYAGPHPSREFETAGLGRASTGKALAPDPAPSQVADASIVPPPGHTAQP